MRVYIISLSQHIGGIVGTTMLSHVEPQVPGLDGRPFYQTMYIQSGLKTWEWVNGVIKVLEEGGYPSRVIIFLFVSLSTHALCQGFNLSLQKWEY